MNGTTSIEVSHYIQVAHRLSLTPGKCQNIHGHSMHVILELHDLPVNKNGMASVDFSDLKKAFRAYLDESYDHHLLLNGNDEWARMADTDDRLALPGLVRMPSDPTVENLARWICQDMVQEVIEMISPEDWMIQITIKETTTNGASYMMYPTEEV